MISEVYAKESFPNLGTLLSCVMKTFSKLGTFHDTNVPNFWSFDVLYCCAITESI